MFMYYIMSSIQPFDKTTVHKIVKFSLDISQLKLNESAIFMVSLYDVNDIVLDRVHITIEGADYKNWGSDDSFIIRHVAKQLGFVLN